MDGKSAIFCYTINYYNVQWCIMRLVLRGYILHDTYDDVYDNVIFISNRISGRPFNVNRRQDQSRRRQCHVMFM